VAPVNTGDRATAGESCRFDLRQSSRDYESCPGLKRRKYPVTREHESPGNRPFPLNRPHPGKTRFVVRRRRVVDVDRLAAGGCDPGPLPTPYCIKTSPDHTPYAFPKTILNISEPVLGTLMPRQQTCQSGRTRTNLAPAKAATSV
jgi:hypothetical protein